VIATKRVWREKDGEVTFTGFILKQQPLTTNDTDSLEELEDFIGKIPQVHIDNLEKTMLHVIVEEKYYAHSKQKYFKILQLLDTRAADNSELLETTHQKIRPLKWSNPSYSGQITFNVTKYHSLRLNCENDSFYTFLLGDILSMDYHLKNLYGRNELKNKPYGDLFLPISDFQKFKEGKTYEANVNLCFFEPDNLINHHARWNGLAFIFYFEITEAREVPNNYC
jgi:hypothetical protein